MSRILKKIDLKLDASVSEAEFGLNLMKGIAENLHIAEKEVNEFLGDLIGVSGEEYSNLPLTVSNVVLAELKGNEDLKSFFTMAVKFSM
jgi:hypothetical protein